MNKQITSDVISSFKRVLAEHPIYKEVETIKDLRCFMEHHVYSVWDFMSLVKYLQSAIAPSNYPWTHYGQRDTKRFINELVLEEESDKHYDSGSFISDFELYQKAMSEIGADTKPSLMFTKLVHDEGLDKALLQKDIPSPSKVFVINTFSYINKAPHVVAAALALGREHIIPSMFRSLLRKTGVSSEEAPVFHYYLNRHIDLDEGMHAPLSIRLLNELCSDDEDKINEAIHATNSAVRARIKFWNHTLEKIRLNKNLQKTTKY